MNIKGMTALKSLLINFQREESLLSFASAELENQIREIPNPRSGNYPSLLDDLKSLESIHYSWFIPVLEHLPVKARSYLIALFPPREANGLSNLLNTPPSSSRPKNFLRPFFTHYLKKLIQEKDVLDLGLLPESESNLLLQINKPQLIHAIDLLGIYDLAADMRQVVNKKLIQKVYNALTQEQLQFFHYCSKQPLRWVSPKLNLEQWDGSHKKLNSILHQRGLYRLGKGIVDEDPSFHWHLVHHLDSGRGKILLKVLTQKYDRELVSYFKAQVLYIIKRYR